MSKSDLALIIPAYNEGEMVLRPLASFALQDPIKSVRSSVFVAINQPALANAEVTRGNHTTAQIIRALAKRQMPEGLSRERIPVIMHESFSTKFDARMFGISVREMAEAILDNPATQIHEINLWEGERAHNNSNVGYARDVATREAMNHIHDRSRIVMTDADTMFHQKYFYYLLAGGIEVGFGPRMPMFLSEKERQLSHQIEPADYFERIIEGLSIDLLHQDNNLSHLYHACGTTGYKKGAGDQRVMVPICTEGPSMFFSPAAFEKAGGFPHLPGGSDTAFHERLERVGHEPYYGLEYFVGILDRTEVRTFSGNSNTTQAYIEQRTFSFEGRMHFLTIQSMLRTLPPQEKYYFVQIFENILGDRVADNDIDLLWKYWEESQHNVDSRCFNEALLSLFAKKFSISYREAIAELEREIKSGEYEVDQEYFLSMLPTAYKVLEHLDSLKKA